MSAETWRAEFYPIEARECPKEKAVEHSLQKWKGLRKESLEEHELEKSPIKVTGGTCSLCQHYDSSEGVTNEDFAIGRTCPQCPLQIIDKNCDEKDSPWDKRLEDGPEPMIAALEKALEWEREDLNETP